MEDEYTIEVRNLDGVLNPDYQIQTQRFIVSFDWRFIDYKSSTDRIITTCCIIENPTKKIYAGASILNPNDLVCIDWIGRRWAYKRAVLVLWMIWNELGRTKMPYKPFWQCFRKALAQNELYLKDRKENKDG